MKISEEHRQKLAVDLLRFGLAFVFLYAGISSLMDPQNWVGYFPDFVRDMVDEELVLKFSAVGEVILAIWLLSGKRLYLAGAVSAVGLISIVLATPNQLIITFRDVGLILAALALTVLTLPSGSSKRKTLEQ